VNCEVLNIAGRAVRTIVADRQLKDGIQSLSGTAETRLALRRQRERIW